MTSERESHHGEWSGGLTFILAATGAAVGLGNIWKFPYIAGEYGGGAFVLAYLFFVLVIGVPIFMSEVMIGRNGRQSPFNSLYIIASENVQSRRWAWLGGGVALTGFILLSYYSVVAGEVLAYAVRVASGVFESQSADGVVSIYNEFRTRPESLLAWHTIFMVITCIIVGRGVLSGLEKTVKYVIPAIVVLMLLLVVNSIYSGFFVNGASFLLDFDIKRLIFARDEGGLYITNAEGQNQFSFQGILTAMGHAFFTLSLGVGAMMVFGAYLGRQVSIIKVTIAITAADTLIAILAGLVIFPIALTYGLPVTQGPSLVFTTLPIAFGSMPFGNIWGCIFFILLFFAALTSAIALLEPTVTWLIEKGGKTRIQAVVWSGLACWMLGIITVFSLSGVTLRSLMFSFADLLHYPDIELNHRFFDLNGFQLIDGLVTLVLLPVAGILIAVFAGWIMKSETSYEEFNFKQAWLYKAWLIMVRYVSPLLVLVILIAGVTEWVRKYLLYQPVL